MSTSHAPSTAKIFGHKITDENYVIYFVQRGNGEISELKEFEMDKDLLNKLAEYKTLVSRVSYDGKSGFYNVKEILAHRNDNGKVRYLVSWEGEKWQHPVWRSEVAERALMKNELLQEYKKKHGI